MKDKTNKTDEEWRMWGKRSEGIETEYVFKRNDLEIKKGKAQKKRRNMKDKTNKTDEE